jgi:hypothetical protein
MLAAFPWLRCWVLVLTIQLIRTIARRCVFALLAIQPRLQLPILATQLVDFGFQLGHPCHRPGMLRFPIARPLTQFEILTPQFNDFLAERDDFPLQILDELEQYPSITRRSPFQQLTVHDGTA